VDIMWTINRAGPKAFNAQQKQKLRYIVLQKKKIYYF
jgi:hypothetical protein